MSAPGHCFKLQNPDVLKTHVEFPRLLSSPKYTTTMYNWMYNPDCITQAIVTRFPWPTPDKDVIVRFFCEFYVFKAFTSELQFWEFLFIILCVAVCNYYRMLWRNIWKTSILYISIAADQVSVFEELREVYMKEKLEVYLSHLQFNFKIAYNHHHFE